MKHLAQQFILLVFALVVLAGCKTERTEIETVPYTVVKVFPHDKEAFTQGLVIEYGRLFESTGQEGASWIAEVDLASGKQNKKANLDSIYFGEGITILGNKIYQLTWKSKIGFVYDIHTFNKVAEFSYNHEGWGITHNGTHLIVSDGTNKIHFLDTATLKEVSMLEVKQHEQAVDKLNELELINGHLYANRWMTNEVLKIDLETGEVIGKLDLSPLSQEAKQANATADVLNGIAYEKKSGLLLVTGKWWPFLFALRLEDGKKK